MLRLGCIKQLGLGSNIDVWNDPWLPIVGNTFVVSARDEEAGVRYVSDLLCVNTKAWNETRIRGLFSREEGNSILQISLSVRQVHDFWHWLGDRKGEYTVRSAYGLVVAHGTQTEEREEE